MRAYSLLANAYVDLGTYGYITPYVGAGIGGTYVKWDKLRNTSCADNGRGAIPPSNTAARVAGALPMRSWPARQSMSPAT